MKPDEIVHKDEYLVSDMDKLTVRARNILIQNNITTYGEVIDTYNTKGRFFLIFGIKNCGKKTMTEIYNYFGLKGGDIDDSKDVWEAMKAIELIESLGASVSYERDSELLAYRKVLSWKYGEDVNIT